MTHAERTPRSIASRSCFHCTAWRSSRSPSPPSRRPPPPPRRASRPSSSSTAPSPTPPAGTASSTSSRTAATRSSRAPNPLRGVSADAASLKDFLTTITGPIVLVGHSYGGVVITNAATGNPNVKALVYIAAFAPDQGDSVLSLSELGTDDELGPAALDIRRKDVADQPQHGGRAASPRSPDRGRR